MIMHYHDAQVDRSTEGEGLLRVDNHELVEIMQDNYVQISPLYGSLSPEYNRTNSSDADYSLLSVTRQGLGPMPWFESPFSTNVEGIPLQKEATGQGWMPQPKASCTFRLPF